MNITLSIMDTLFNTSHTMDLKTGIILFVLALVATFVQGFYRSTHPMDGKKPDFPKNGKQPPATGNKSKSGTPKKKK